MTRLSNYLVRLFSAEAAALLGVGLTILFLVQTLRVADSASVRGQGFLPLMGQVLLNLPPLGMTFFYVCVAIGLGRALRALQASRELHILHVSQRLPALLGALAVYVGGATVLILVIAHIVEPATTQQNNLIRAQVAADLVGRSLVPNRFAEVTGGVTITVGGRRADGEITSFFADDRRAATRRTYISETALLIRDEFGYVMRLRDGAIQYRNPDGGFSEITFARYDLAIDRLTSETDAGEERGDRSSIGLVATALATGEWPGSTVERLSRRNVEGLRVVALCLLVAALSALPTGRRREPLMPIEFTVLGAAFLERLVAQFAPGSGLLPPMAGVIVIGTIAIAILVARLHVFAPYCGGPTAHEPH
ncbi:MAG: LptF/LptG family permease [Devosia sp.]|nr:LptF/LptG family permease [Devosia sp.]